MHTLFIRNVNDADAGEYRVEAGKAKSEANLQVLGKTKKPTTKKPKTPNVVEITPEMVKTPAKKLPVKTPEKVYHERKIIRLASFLVDIKEGS
jgi:hypothetical protein